MILFETTNKITKQKIDQIRYLWQKCVAFHIEKPKISYIYVPFHFIFIIGLLPIIYKRLITCYLQFAAAYY